MARIRTIKPEAFASESLAEVSITAERTFFGLLTLADDHGRFRDQAAVIAGALWALRPGHGPLEVEDDLTQLAGAGLICRYQGDDGKNYLHLVTWARHQKINRPSGSRCPGCPRHDGGRPARPVNLHAGVPEVVVSPHGALGEDARRPPEPPLTCDEVAGQWDFSADSVSPQGGVTERSVRAQRPDLGPRILDLGSPPVGDASVPAPTDTVSARTLIAEYVAGCKQRPPSGFLGHLGREVAKLLTDGIDATYVRAGLERQRAKGLHPSTLPSLVNEAMNPPAANGTSPGHQPWTNPVDAQAAYGGEL